ncbi:hypothetical protein BMF94_1616 [Rhodotorula taiwanensis]|uniref:Pyroglutamyl-peptidase I n=1 Tax=Rhodotorula taiwanensis TaxID=741276 RepID=A0A2S5BEN8_9BASI|nr:hypothetical protein BMF94_1616 [Rhodotorula taiwanensis]
MAAIELESDGSKPFRVHLTGFGPFRDIAVNPSWLAVKPLDGEVLSEPPPPLRTQSAVASPSTETADRGIKLRYRPVHLSTSLLPVEYSAVSDLAPKLQTDGEEKPDLVIHVGVSAGDSAIRLEQRARKFGYNSPDAAGKLADAGSEPEGAGRSDSRRRGFVGKEWEAAPEELRTRVDGAGVVRWCKSQGVDWVSLSEDAGLYLCEYSFFASMATARRLRPDAPTLVQFVHVPSVGNPYTAEELTAALRLIVWAIAADLPRT